MRILIVDDSAIARTLLQAILTAQGYDVATADNGADAWALWERGQHRVVVSDWMMPGLDGLELCRRIRAHIAAPYTYFILETVRSGGVAEAMAAGVDDFITKPIVPTELLARLMVAARVVGQAGTRDALGGTLRGTS
jgi:phosphoserine phosphatase RsbU/P